MNIAFVGCGFVFDIYMRTVRAHPELNVKGLYDIDLERLSKVSSWYGFPIYDSLESLLSDPDVEIVVNLTNIGSHYEVSKKALEAGKHVYSEKPLTDELVKSQELFEIQERTGSQLYCAPSNVYSDSVRTLFKAVEDGAIGKPLLVYAELDDNPIHLMEFENVRSPSGAPWPLREEIYEGCTFEHVGYHLVWICALFGPAVSVTAFSAELIDNKMEGVPGKVGTPDYSVACLSFENGATARITCSVVAPRDHRMRIIGEKGEVRTDSYRQYQSPVHWETYTKTSLNARKFQTLRKYSFLGRIFGIGGSRLKLVKNPKSIAVEKDQQLHSGFKQRLIEWLRRKEVYAQDKLIGISEMARELNTNSQRYLSSEFLLHINELTLLIQGAGSGGVACKLKTSFSPLGPIPETIAPNNSFAEEEVPGILSKLFSK
jgi:predicted dehydrogenase